MFHLNNNNNFDGRFKKVKSEFPNFGRENLEKNISVNINYNITRKNLLYTVSF